MVQRLKKCNRRVQDTGILYYAVCFVVNTWYFCFASLVPDGIPENVEAGNSSSKTLSLNWDAIPRGTENGILKGYRIALFDTLRNITLERYAPPEASQIEIQDLRPYTEYKIQITAYNDAGSGNASITVDKRTDQDGKIAINIQKYEREN